MYHPIRGMKVNRSSLHIYQHPQAPWKPLSPSGTRIKMILKDRVTYYLVVYLSCALQNAIPLMLPRKKRFTAPGSLLLGRQCAGIESNGNMSCIYGRKVSITVARIREYGQCQYIEP